MLPTFIEIENILKTLPVGYYIGRNVPLKLTNENGSYYVPMDDEAYISYPMLNNVMTKIESKLNDENIERLTRTLTYHEISHAFITPKSLSINNIVNVFEDERIESICRNYYKGVDFKELLMLVNDWDGKTEPAHDTAFSVWYSLVRYHLGKPHFLIKVAALLKKYRKLHRFSDYWSSYNYKNEIMALYREVEKDFIEDELKKQRKAEEEAKAADEEKQKNDNTGISMNAGDDNDAEEPDEMNETEFNIVGQSEVSPEELREKQLEEQLNKMSDEELQELFENITRAADEEVKKLFENSQVYVNPGVQERLANIILANKKVTKSNASAINAYSGVFDPRSVIRDDYKWFVQQNRQGNVKQFSKIKLNLFIDNSGSFYSNETIVNQLLFALKKLEQQEPNFTFDLITMNTRFELKKKNKRELHCGGGNDIPAYSEGIIKKVQDRQSMNYNIVLFDGDALSISTEGRSGKQFKRFNMPNTVMILEDSNRKYAETYCKGIRRIYTRRYATELIDQVCVALRFLLK
nr:MAG TPA: cobalamin biosynthesis protein [Caudoviricetes sp.]